MKMDTETIKLICVVLIVICAVASIFSLGVLYGIEIGLKQQRIIYYHPETGNVMSTCEQPNNLRFDICRQKHEESVAERIKNV